MISIHAPREGCDVTQPHTWMDSPISIHAPREGCDQIPNALIAPGSISIHAPREGCDRALLDASLALAFQSTHPVRGATGSTMAHRRILGISIHAPREGCDTRRREPTGGAVISIHAPREGCDSARC